MGDIFSAKVGGIIIGDDNQQEQLIIYGIYFSANGFSDEVEQWLHDQGILTIDLDTWKQ